MVKRICLTPSEIIYGNISHLFFRAIVWLQNKRDATLERQRGPAGHRRPGGHDDVSAAHDYKVGRLKHERVTIPRCSDHRLLDWAMQLMQSHADRKSILEVNRRLICQILQ